MWVLHTGTWKSQCIPQIKSVAIKCAQSNPRSSYEVGLVLARVEAHPFLQGVWVASIKSKECQEWVSKQIGEFKVGKKARSNTWRSLPPPP